MRRWALALFCIQIVASSCPSGFELVSNGQCRGHGEQGVIAVMNEWEQEAVRVCKQKNANPIIIHNQEEQDYWTNVSTHSTNLYIPLGIECNTSSKKWQWADGSPIDYKPPTYYHPALDEDCKSPWVFYMYKSNPGEWHGYSGTDNNTIDIYCVLNLAPPEQLPEGCFHADENGKELCFAISNSSGNWNVSRELCANYGASVASIHSEQENSFLRRTAVSRGFVNGLFLGAIKSGKTDTFSWLDGSNWDYHNYMPGFPVDGLGDCLVMDTYDVKGQWANAECSAMMPIACEKRGSPGCSTPFPDADELISTPGYPHDASVPCEMFLKVDPGKLVEVTVVSLEANTCCDHLLLYEGSFGGNLVANLTGEMSDKTFRSTTTNVMRASWQPNDGKNVRGAVINFRAV